MIKQTLQQFIDIAQQQDFTALQDLLAEDVVLHSPTMATPIADKNMAHMAISTAIALLHQGDLQVLSHFVGDNAAMVDLQSTFEGQLLNVADQFSVNEQGKICEFKVFLRPITAANLFCEEMTSRMRVQLAAK